MSQYSERLNETTIKLNKLAGIRVDMKFSGEYGKVTIESLNAALASFIAILIIISTFVEKVAMWCCNNSSLYTNYKYLDTKSATAYREGNIFYF